MSVLDDPYFIIEFILVRVFNFFKVMAAAFRAFSKLMSDGFSKFILGKLGHFMLFMTVLFTFGKTCFFSRVRDYFFLIDCGLGCRNACIGPIIIEPWRVNYKCKSIPNDARSKPKVSILCSLCW